MTQSTTEPIGSRDKILAAVGNAATRLMTGDNPSEDINNLLSDVGQALDICRAYIFEKHVSPEGIPVVSQRYEQTRDDVPAEIDNELFQNLPLDNPCFGWMTPVLQEGRIVQGNVEDFLEAERAVLEAQGIRSILLVPIFVRSAWWGFIGFDACRRTRTWKDSEVDALRIAAGLVGASLYQQQIRTELEWRESRFHALLDNMPSVGVQGYDENGSIHYWNKACENFYGYTAEEAIGANIADLIVPPDMRDFVRSAIQEGAKTGQMPPPGEHNLMRKDGSLTPILSSHACIAVPGQPVEMFCIDVSLAGRNKIQQDLRRLRQHAEHIREDEQRRIAQRIHDEFGQRLTTLTMNLTRLRDSLSEPDDETFVHLNDNLTIIEELLALARDVSMELRPSVLDHFGLSAALEWAAENLESAHGISAELDLDEDLHLEQGTRSSLYRIAQELLTNVVRHASASNILITLRYRDDNVQLAIMDDGVGMETTEVENIKTMGLIGIRETALTLGGQVEIDSIPGLGTNVQITVPASQTERNSI